MMNAENVVDLKTHAANEATIRQQDIASLQAGLEELRTLHTHLAEDSRRLVDFQRQTMHFNKGIKKAQDDTS
jgi:hypothetical protein